MRIEPGVPSGTIRLPPSNGTPIAKYGPTVWEGVTSKIIVHCLLERLFEQGRRGTAQVDVPVERLRPVRTGLMDVEGRDHPLARLLIPDRVVDRVIREERIVGEVHLRHQPLRERTPQQ